MKPDRQHPLYLPFATALRDKLRGGYNLSKLRADLLAGVTVGIVAVPLALAILRNIPGKLLLSISLPQALARVRHYLGESATGQPMLTEKIS